MFSLFAKLGKLSPAWLKLQITCRGSENGFYFLNLSRQEPKTNQTLTGYLISVLLMSLVRPVDKAVSGKKVNAGPIFSMFALYRHLVFPKSLHFFITH